MSLTHAHILAADDDALVDLLGKEIERLIPESAFEHETRFYIAVDSLPRGLRAMQSIYQLDVSMALDDLAWHFLNHPSDRAARQTHDGLLELNLAEPAALFKSAWDIWSRHLDTYRTEGLKGMKPHAFLEHIGVQERIDPLNDQLWSFIETQNGLGLLRSWALYARKHPDRCLAPQQP